jgi:hypothetical protein
VTVNSPGPVPGSTVLAAGVPHPHASEDARSIAEKGTTLRVQVGSGVHGTSIDGLRYRHRNARSAQISTIRLDIPVSENNWQGD